jgi:hypothetical protein
MREDGREDAGHDDASQQPPRPGPKGNPFRGAALIRIRQAQLVSAERA